MRWLGIVAIVATIGVLEGCAQYSLISTVRHDLDGFSVDPQIEWSSITENGIEVWTVNGSSLEAIYLVDDIEHGDPLFKQQFGAPKKELPLFRAAMNANEVVEFVVDTLITSGLGEVQVTELQPKKFGSHSGFRFNLEYLLETGLKGRGMAFGAIIDDKLYLILYLAVSEHYFTTYGGHVERIFDSIKTP